MRVAKLLAPFRDGLAMLVIVIDCCLHAASMGTSLHRKAERSHVSAIDQDAGTLQFVPIFTFAVGVLDEVGTWFIGKPMDLAVRHLWREVRW